MSNRFDDIFSLDRLRQNWKTGQEEMPGDSSPLPAPVQVFINARSDFEKLREILNNKYPGKKGEGLRILTQELEQAVFLRFPENKKVDEQEKAGLNQTITGILNQIEDLEEALDIN
ncbi:Uncharacterized protein dnl_35390 [Desulfonema limicola]|uniref:Uncharacterized protein n=1 Tax=Desulfonema limicola TaxID=45656 RepID=A0A975GHY2_9BACT|nr:hypothetical protein [Desulfonema limicola]QTA81208.1 Uncharacterized protein dnl_35390 [Desulfonema limicola]